MSPPSPPRVIMATKGLQWQTVSYLVLLTLRNRWNNVSPTRRSFIFYLKGTYVNTEGRAQQTFPALSPPGQVNVRIIGVQLIIVMMRSTFFGGKNKYISSPH